MVKNKGRIMISDPFSRLARLPFDQLNHSECTFRRFRFDNVLPKDRPVEFRTTCSLLKCQFSEASLHESTFFMEMQGDTSLLRILDSFDKIVLC
jgi:hypothetical protein